MLPCFVLCWIWNQQWSYNTALHKQPVYELIVQIKRPLVFLGYLFWEKNTFSSLLFLLVCLFFLVKHITSMYSTFFLRKRKGIKTRSGCGASRGTGSYCVAMSDLELLYRPSCPGTHGWSCLHMPLCPTMYFWSDNKVAWTPSGSWGTWQW